MWLNIISDSLIALAYYSIPITLVYFVRKRVDLPFNWIVLLFGSFIVACGTTHIMEIWTLWHPTYWLSGLLKAITAVVSLYTAIALMVLVPQALALPSSAQLEKANQELEREINERKLVEETLRESEDRFRSAFDYAPIGMAIVAPDGRWLRVNRSLCEIVGYGEQELLAATFQSISHPDDLDTDLDYTRQLLSGEIGTYQMEKRYFHKLGHVVWILLSASLVHDTQGQPLYIISQIQDITERKLAEEQLRWQEALMRSMTSASPLAFYVVDNRTDAIVYFNHRFCEIWGIEHLKPGMQQGLFKNNDIILDCLPRLMDVRAFAEVYESLQSEENTAVVEDEILLVDGCTIRCFSTQVRDEQERYFGRLYIFEDITQRKQSEARLRLLERAIATSKNGIIISDAQLPDKPIIYVNSGFERITGYTPSEVIGKNCRLLQGTNTKQPALEQLRCAISSGTETQVVLRNYRKDGTLFWNELCLTPVTDETGRLTHFIGIQTDITERKRTEEALTESEERWQLAIRGSNDGIWDWNIKTNEVFFSARWKEMLGYEDHEISNHLDEWTSRVHPDDLDWMREVIQNHFAKKTPFYITEHRVLCKDGTYKWILARGQALWDENGTVLRMAGYHTDITERKQAEEALQQQFLREKLVGAITQRIRQSLNLEEILKCTVQEVKQVLACERVLVYRLWPEGTGSIVTEAVVPGLCTNLEQNILEDVFPEDFQRLYNQGWICAISNVEQADISPSLVKFVQQFGAKAKLVVPILQGEQLWGVLIAHQCSEPRQWKQFEINLLQQIAAQVAIAIQQGQLYKQAQAHAHQLEQTLQELQRTQAQLVQSEKMSSLGQLVAGVTHEINNPLSFIYANIQPATEYAQDLIHLAQLYRQHSPEPAAEITQQLERIEPTFIEEDFPKLLASMKEGADRISQIVQSLRNFSRLDEKGFKRVDIHEGIDNTLLILEYRLKQQSHRPEIQVIKEYGQLPKVECCPGQLNQVFMNILCNAIDALDELDVSKSERLNVDLLQTPEGKEFSLGVQPSNRQHSTPCIRIDTEVVEGDWVTIRIADNGSGIQTEVQPKIFDPFFTTKPVGNGKGLGLSISYQIVVDKHGGKLLCHSVTGQGTEFAIALPIVQGKMPLGLDG